jgi:Yip1-like protein
LVGVYTDPIATFQSIAAHPAFIAPLIAMMLVNASFTFVWLRKADHTEVARVQLEDLGILDRIPPDQHGAALKRQAGLIPLFAWLGPLVFLPLVIVALAALFLFTYRFFYEADTTFSQSLAVQAWSFFAFYLLATTMMVLVLVLKGEWSVDPRTVIQANPAALVDRTSVGKPVYDLLDSIDLFSAWTIFLLAAGYAATARRSVASAAVGILVWWGLYVLLKVALAAVF